MRDYTQVHYESVGSTQAVAKALLASGRQAPFVVVADRQTSGIGRYHHHFSSPTAGLYFTYAMPAPAALHLATPAAGVALAQVLQGHQRQVQIKWVNDLLYHEQKVVGILAEWVPTPTPTILIGVGINLGTSDARTVLADALPAGHLNLPTTSAFKQQLLGQWVARFDALLAQPTAIMPAYRQLAAWLNQRVTWRQGDTRLSGTLIGFSDDGSARLLTDAGVITRDVGSIRLAAD